MRSTESDLRPLDHRTDIIKNIYITLVIKRTICHFPILTISLTCFISLKTAIHSWDSWKDIYLNKKKKCVNEVQEPAPDRGRVSKEEKKKTFSTRLLMNSLFFMSCNGLKFSHPCQLSVDDCSQVTKKKLKEDDFLSVL